MCIWPWRKPGSDVQQMCYVDQTDISDIMDAKNIWQMAMLPCKDAHLFHKMSIWTWSNGCLTWFRCSCPGWHPNCTGELGKILVGTDGHLDNLEQCSFFTMKSWLLLSYMVSTIITSISSFLTVWQQASSACQCRQLPILYRWCVGWGVGID